jgi:hypothetical protein
MSLIILAIVLPMLQPLTKINVPPLHSSSKLSLPIDAKNIDVALYWRRRSGGLLFDTLKTWALVFGRRSIG